MRKVFIAVLTATMLMLAGAAHAQTINGTSGSDHLVGTAQADSIHGNGARDEAAYDYISGRGAGDTLTCGVNAHILHDTSTCLILGGRGNDLLHAGWGLVRNVTLNAGGGHNDTCWGHPATEKRPGTVFIGCETIHYDEDNGGND